MKDLFNSTSSVPCSLYMQVTRIKRNIKLVLEGLLFRLCPRASCNMWSAFASYEHKSIHVDNRLHRGARSDFTITCTVTTRNLMQNVGQHAMFRGIEQNVSTSRSDQKRHNQEFMFPT